MEPLISVIVPVYNVERYLGECVESIINQTYKNLEIILVDDGSPDDCGRICDEYALKDERIKVIHKQNAGPSSARNKGLVIATGEYVSFVDSDDYISDDFFMNLSKYDSDVVISGLVGENSFNDERYDISFVKENYYNLGGFEGPVAKLYKKKVIENLLFDESILIGEDIIFNLDVIDRIKNIQYTSYCGYYVRNNCDSITRKSAKKYDPNLDLEYQDWWGKLLYDKLISVGIPQKAIEEHNNNGCSIWIYQKIKNIFYKDCKESFSTKLKKADDYIKNNRETILSVKNPLSRNTHLIIKICCIINNKYFTCLLFKVFVIMGK